jgi:hypothetical protein
MYYNASSSYTLTLLADVLVTCMYSQVCIQGDVLSPLDIVWRTYYHSRSSETTCYRNCAFFTYTRDEILF